MTTAPPSERPSAIILAAGLSSRMGRFKPLLPLGARCVVERVIDLFRTVGVEEICVVVGHRAAALRPTLQAAGVIVAENPRYAEGMFTSIQAGLARLAPCKHGVFILPVDIPLVRPATLRLMMDAFASRGANTTIHPIYDGRRGHPPLIPAELTAAIQNHDGAGGLRTILEAPGVRALEIPVPDRFVLLDMDHPEAYEVVKQALVNHDLPDDDECEVLLGSTWEIAEPVQRHCRLVTAAAVAIAEALGRAGVDLDLRLIRAGALLHDIAKGEKGHARAGAERLRQLHFDRVAAIVACHDDLTLTEATDPGEAEVVFIADKHIRGERIMPMEGRFALALERFGDIPAARQNILRRRDAALAIREGIEARIRRPLSDLIAQAVRHCGGTGQMDPGS